MLQWSDSAYWATQRFIPGSINRWRGADYRRKLEDIGLEVLSFSEELRDALPIARHLLAGRFRDMDEKELRCTAIDVVARMTAEPTPVELELTL